MDRRLGIAGLAHVVLPQSPGRAQENPRKFADFAVPELVVELEALGARKARLEAVLVGGASMFAVSSASLEVGQRNEAAVRELLEGAAHPRRSRPRPAATAAARSASTSRPRRVTVARGGRQGHRTARRHRAYWRLCDGRARRRSGPERRRDRRARRRRARGPAARRGADAAAAAADARGRLHAPDQVHGRPGAAPQAQPRGVLPHRVHAACRPSCACRSSSRSSTRRSSRGRTRTARCWPARSPRSSRPSRSARAC